LTKWAKKDILKHKPLNLSITKQKRERIMNKKILTVAASLAVTTMSFGAACEGDFETWLGDQMEYQVTTGCDAGGEKSGYWYFYDDNKPDGDGKAGASKLTWPVELGNADSDAALDNVIDYCGGVCGDVELDQGTLGYDPFVGVGINIAGSEDADSEDMLARDATAWGGVCIAYTLDFPGALELGLGDAEDSRIEFNNPFVKLPKSPTANVLKFEWSDFSQDKTWGKVKITAEEAVAELVSLKVKMKQKDGTKGHFNIMSIGPYGDTCKATTPGGGSSAIGAKALKSSLKAQLSGRTLSFGKTVAKAEIVNLHGQVVMSASSVSTMDLAKLQAGVYMVRSMGLSQQIMLK
jgi:hypothetical protein